MKELIQRIKNDDLDAVESLYQQVKSTGMKVAVSYVGKEGLEEDMFHEAFIKAIENLDRFDENRSFQAWFDVILANTCKSYLRKKKTEKLQDKSEEEEDVYDEETSSIGNPEECWDQEELRQIIKNMLEELSTEQKEAIILHYYQNMSIAKIAEFQDCSQETVKSRLYQGRNKLKLAVEAYEKKTNVKLHSIGILPALFVFFKSSMGQSYACEYMEGAEKLAKKIAKEKAKALTKSAAEDATKEVIKETAKEAGKAATMKLSAKIAIGAAVLLLVGGGAAAVILNSQNDNEVSEIIAQATVEGDEPSEAEQVTESVEESITASEENAEIAEENSETTEGEEETSEITESGEAVAENPAAGITVHSVENGVKRITADADIVTFSSANGGVIITYSETDGCGAIDYDGNVLVPNSYPYYYDIPDNKGNFALGDSSTIDIFDRNGNLVHTISNWQSWDSIRVSEGYVTYAVYDIDTETATVSCYDIENDVLTSNSFQDNLVFIRVCDVIDGRYLCSYGETAGQEDKGIFYASTDGTITPIQDDGMFCIRIYGNPYEGYTLGEWTEMSGSHYLFSEDFSEKIPFGIGNGFTVVPFVAEGNQYYNKGTKIAIGTEGFSNDSEMKYYLMDLEGYTEDKNIKTCILAEYDYIRLSACGICYAEDESGNFFLREDGTKIEDTYVDHSAFTDKYAAVLDGNGLAYLIDSDMNVLTEGYEAERVYLRDQFPCYEYNNTQTLFIIE